MNTAYPATGTALSCFEFTHKYFEMVFPRLLFFDEGNPANPLITREWSETLPVCLY